MELVLKGERYEAVDAVDRVTMADSVVVPSNKIGSGNGEAKIYVGHDSDWLRSFYGDQGFGIKCVMFRKDLIRYLEETRVEYLNPEQPYRKRTELPQLWKKRRKEVEALPEIIEFEIEEQAQIAGPRVYINSHDKGYQLLRQLSLPNITYFSVAKLESEAGRSIYYFRLFVDYFGSTVHPSQYEDDSQDVNNVDDPELKKQLRDARSGQGKYRKELYLLCPVCPFTTIGDDRLLTASHIKPWVKSTLYERTDPYNGFMFTPTYDRLFDRGFISFTDDGVLMLSPFLSRMTYGKLNIRSGTKMRLLPVTDREKYLEYHRKEVFRGI